MSRRLFLKFASQAPALALPWLGVAALTIPARAAATAKVGLLIPMSGPAALFGPSSRNCAELAVDEINGRKGLAGVPIELAVADVGVPPAAASQAALKLWKGAGVKAFVGMHDSAVRAALVSMFQAKVPYVYTPTYEGGECARGTWVLGETPAQQLAPVIPWIGKHREARRWYLIGNDYNWPRDTNTAAKRYIAEAGGSVVGEEYLPFTADNFDASLSRIRDSNADAVLVTLVGGASVTFNRTFASFGLADKTVRLGTLIEENTLKGIGAQNSANLYASAGYFAAIDTPAARAFAERYQRKFGPQAPTLNALAQSCYEGLLLLEALADKAGSLSTERMDAVASQVSYEGPRGHTVMQSRHAKRDIFLSQAVGDSFKVVASFPAVGAGEACRA